MERTPLVRRALLAMQRHSWEQGVAMQAMLETGDAATLALMAHEAVTRQDERGRAAVLGFEGATDPCCVGEGLLHSARATGSARLWRGFRRLMDWAQTGAPRAEDGTLYHLMDRPQMWVDSLYMLPPFLAAAGEYAAAVAQIDGLLRRLKDPGSGLLASRWDEAEGRLCAPEHWGVGIGWALAGMARVRRALPGEMAAEREWLSGEIAALLGALRPLMRPDGLYHNIVDDPGSFVETNLAQMAAYTVYRGLAQGWLPGKMEGWAETMRAAACGKVDELGFVRDVCGAPRFDTPGTAPEGQAFHLLMEQAREDWQNGRP